MFQPSSVVRLENAAETSALIRCRLYDTPPWFMQVFQGVLGTRFGSIQAVVGLGLGGPEARLKKGIWWRHHTQPTVKRHF